MNKMSKSIVILLAITGIAATSIALAQDESDTETAPESGATQDMMQGGDMMGMMGMMTQMSEMMQTCNQMMKTMMPENGQPQQEKRDG